MKLSWIILIGALLTQNVSAQVSPGLSFARSQSGQFTARSSQDVSSTAPIEEKRVPMAGGWAFNISPTQAPSVDSEKLLLEPALTVVSCERLKKLLLNELQVADQWRGRIQINIDSLSPENSEPELTVVREPGGWSYELTVPARIRSFAFFRALVNVMLLEVANRGAAGESAQIPLWLAEGMTAHLQAENLPVFVVQPRTTMVANRVSIQALEGVRKSLREKPPLTFEQLSWPGPEELAGTNDFYRGCAQLFVCELLRLKRGPECMRQMLNELPKHLNWQIAFLRGYESHFSQLLQVEKWWGLVCVNFTTRDAKATWTPEESLRRLQDTLDIPVQIHLSPERLPTAAALTLQEVIMEWDKAEAIATVQRTVESLLFLQPRLTRETAALAESYRKVLETYLRQESKKSLLLRGRTHSSIVKTTCKRLSELDGKRAELRTLVVDRKPARIPRQGRSG